MKRSLARPLESLKMEKRFNYIFFILLICLTSCFEDKNNDFHQELFGDNFGEEIVICEKQHPTMMYEKAGEAFQSKEYNKAGFFFYLARVRYQYYITTNPNVQVDGDKAIFSSLNYVFGSEINPYFMEHIDEFIQIIDSVIEWCEANDYAFYSKKNSPENYDNGIMQLKQVKKELEKKL